MFTWRHSLLNPCPCLCVQPPEQLWQVRGCGGEGSARVHQIRAQQCQQQQRSWNPAGESEQVETFFFYSKWTGDAERTTSCAADCELFLAANGNVFRKWIQPGRLMRRWWKNITVWRTKWCCENTGSTQRCPLCVGVHLKVCTTHNVNLQMLLSYSLHQ